MLVELGTEALNFESCYTGQNGKQSPCFHLPRDLTETLIKLIRQNLRSSPLYVHKGYGIKGTYATKELVYAYPM